MNYAQKGQVSHSVYPPPKKDEPYGHQAREKHVAYHNNRLTRADTDSQSRREGEKGERVICITLDIRLEFYDF